MEDLRTLFIVVSVLLLIVNYDLKRLYNYISFKLFGGKKLSPKETKFN